MLIAQITDLHIGFDRDNPHELNVRRLNMVIDELNERVPRPDLLLVTGDLVENGDDKRAYRHMESLVKRWQGPLLWAVGNHDDRANLLAVLPEVPVDEHGFIQYEAEFGGLRFVVLDTLDPGRHGGMVCETRGKWLRARLREKKEVPTVVVLHHPPVDTGIAWMSALPCEQWVQRLESILKPAKQVVGLISGHVHRPISTSFAGKRLIVAPSTAPQVALDLDDVDPQHPDGRALIIADAPAYALHYWDGRTLLTHFEIAGPRNVIASYNSNVQPMMTAFLRERGTG
ncbi:MAG TPA: phosphodiesterase [Sphingomicrobium sp.]|nr:phosphodiesterase [Sphingomicrobium sp.]